MLNMMVVNPIPMARARTPREERPGWERRLRKATRSSEAKAFKMSSGVGVVAVDAISPTAAGVGRFRGEQPPPPTPWASP